MKIRWRQSAPGRYIDLEWRNGSIYLEDGPDVWPKRGHEGGGGTFAIQELRDGDWDFLDEYDGLYERLIDDLSPRFRVSDAQRGVVVTLDAELKPCPTPCRFAMLGTNIYVYPDTSEPAEHLTAAPQASLFVAAATPDDAGAQLPWWARMSGSAKQVDGPEWDVQRAAELFADKYGHVRADEPNHAPTIKIDIERWESHPDDDT